MQWIKWNGNLLYQVNGGTPTRDLQGDLGTGWPRREIVIESQGNRYANSYRGVRSFDKVVTAELVVSTLYEPIKLNLEAEVRQWENWHNEFIELATLQVMMEGGTLLELDAVAHTPIWRDMGYSAKHVTQSWTSPSKYWRSVTESSEAGAFNDANPVTISCTNAGTVPAWLRIDITGVVDTPKLQVGTHVIELNLDMTHGNDNTAIVCTPPATVIYTPNGGPAEAAYGYRTSVSTFTLFQLPASATTDVTLTAATGTATVTLYWYDWFGTN